MKVLAVLTLAPEAPLGILRAELVSELKGSWALYASGVLREVYATEDPKRVVFVMEANDAAAAKRQLEPLPLVAAGMFKIEYLELRADRNFKRPSGPRIGISNARPVQGCPQPCCA